MSSCDNCGKVFKYPYLLLRHLQRKTPCIRVDKKKGCVKDLTNDCKGSVKAKYECDICKKIFSCRQSKYEHKKNVKCSPPEDKVEKLEKKIKELEEKISTSGKITNNNNTTNNNINNTFAPVYNITYVKETGSMICDNPELDDNEMLCIEGFQREAIINKRLNNMDYPKLNRLTMNVIEYEEYDEFFKFLFRDDTNRRMHFMSLGQNVGATYCEAFKQGKIEKFEKEQLFNRVMGYVCGHLTILDNKYAPLNNMLFTKKSKRSFENALRKPSEQFQMFVEE